MVSGLDCATRVGMEDVCHTWPKVYTICSCARKKFVQQVAWELNWLSETEIRHGTISLPLA